jgi:predicted deacylase
MDYKSWHSAYFESRLKGRYVTQEHLYSLLRTCSDTVEFSTAGVSELGRDIPMVKIGSGEKIVLGWSQMHGNEATTTKAIADFLKFITQKEYCQDEITRFLEQFTVFLLPILNPDGAVAYTRENLNSVDLNRDAQNLSQKESQILRAIFDEIKPELCLNLHDQRSIYGLETGLPATVSFLAPAADEKRSITAARKIAMEHIVRMNKALQHLIPGQVGRYDDSFNADCVGDTFQMEGVPTILFEAGHAGDDYQRDRTRYYIFYAFLELFQILEKDPQPVNYEAYFDIPENRVNYKDLILRNVKYGTDDALVDIAVQFSEVLKNEKVIFEAILEIIGDASSFYGHHEIDLEGESILINSQEKFKIGEKVSIIVKKKDTSMPIFSN